MYIFSIPKTCFEWKSTILLSLIEKFKNNGNDRESRKNCRNHWKKKKLQKTAKTLFIQNCTVEPSFKWKFSISLNSIIVKPVNKFWMKIDDFAKFSWKAENHRKIAEIMENSETHFRSKSHCQTEFWVKIQHFTFLFKFWWETTVTLTLTLTLTLN